jgi:hypothetical protein
VAAIEWGTYGGGLERRFFNATETQITKDTVGFCRRRGGAREGPPEEMAYSFSLIPSTINAFCLSGTDGCPVCVGKGLATSVEAELQTAAIRSRVHS